MPVSFYRHGYQVIPAGLTLDFTILALLLIQLVYQGLASENGCQHPCEAAGLCQTKKVDDRCYYVFTNGDKTWQGTKELCASNNMTLVKLDPEVLQDQFNLKDLTERDVIGSKVWLGGKVEELQEWTYLNGVPQSRTRSGKISAFGVGEHIYQCAMILSNATVRKADCRHKFPFICRFDDWRGGPIYQITDVATTWFEARSFCTSRGGDLFFLKENENILFLKNKLAAFQNQMLFIGLTHRTWRWEDGEEVKQYNWLDTEPNSISEKCMAMYSREGLWIDMDCNATMNAFCQKVMTVHSDEKNLTALVESPQNPITWIPVGVILLTMGLIILILFIGLIGTCLFLLRQRATYNIHETYEDASTQWREMMDIQKKRKKREDRPERPERMDDAEEKMGSEMSSLIKNIPALERLLTKTNETNEELVKKVKDLEKEMQSVKRQSLSHWSEFEALEKHVKSLSMPTFLQRNEKDERNEELGKKVRDLEVKMESLSRQKNKEIYQPWPLAVTFKEDKLYAYIHLKLWDMEQLSWTLLDLNVFPDSKNVLLQARIRNSNGSESVYEYKKTLPMEIVPVASKVKHQKEYIVLELKKADENHLWQPYMLYLISRT